jgi:hypothetical protein
MKQSNRTNFSSLPGKEIKERERVGIFDRVCFVGNLC